MSERSLARGVSLPGAVMMGMGSIVGTGVFVSLGLAAGLTGASMMAALFLAGLLAVCNGLSTAQLAADHPLSGGTYEYGYKHLTPWMGFFAGWLFVVAKSASAATAALGLGGYFIQLLGLQLLTPWQVGFVAVVLAVTLSVVGIKRTSFANAAIVSTTLVSLLLFVFSVGPAVAWGEVFSTLRASWAEGFTWGGFFEATALLFVAYTGYGRIATLGEEIKDPVRNIPKAISLTLTLTFFFYIAVAAVSLAAVGPGSFYELTVETAAPLEGVSRLMGQPLAARLLGVGAITAMLGVLLNLVLGISRVVYAMGKKGDLPALFASVEKRFQVPFWAIIFTGLVILCLLALRDVKATWSFSAFTVLFYYAITNAAALRLPKQKRLYPRSLAWLGLLGCLSLSFWVDQKALLLGFSILAAGALWRSIFTGVKK